MLDALALLAFVIDKHNRQETPLPNDFKEASLAADIGELLHPHYVVGSDSYCMRAAVPMG